jgi:serine/threonine protein kinase
MAADGDKDDEGRREAAVAAFLEAAPGVANRTAAADASLPANDPELAAFLQQHVFLTELGSWWRAAAGDGAEAHIEEQGGGASEANEAGALPSLPGYEILREIARGGMGVVYEARQVGLNRPVAVKVILHGALASGADRRRFATEAAAAAKLKHPNIVVIHEVGDHAGQPFFSMEYVAGESLAKITRARRLPAEQAARYVADVARAVQFAHEHGVLHRDIKPSNVLIDETGRVRVMDFGLAKEVDADDKLTVTGQLLGTPSYMAPEQITGPASAIGPACDVYGLGALLYELITGQPPFRGATQVETLLASMESDPPLPRKLNPSVPRPLEMIALKCLEKQPADRYATAADVAADLDRFLDSETLSISSPNLLDRLVRTLERSKFDREIHAWALMLMHVAWIALAAHGAVFVNAAVRVAHPTFNLALIRTAGIAAMVVVFWARRADWYPPRGPAARQLWALWLGYLAGTAALVAIDFLQTPRGTPYYGLGAYPSMAVLASLAFMMLGASYWGYCYLIGALFLVLAVAMTIVPLFGPLAFGVCWGASLALLGRRLAHLARPGTEE